MSTDHWSSESTAGEDSSTDNRGGMSQDVLKAFSAQNVRSVQLKVRYTTSLTFVIRQYEEVTTSFSSTREIANK